MMTFFTKNNLINAAAVTAGIIIYQRFLKTFVDKVI